MAKTNDSPEFSFPRIIEDYIKAKRRFVCLLPGLGPTPVRIRNTDRAGGMLFLDRLAQLVRTKAPDEIVALHYTSLIIAFPLKKKAS